MCSSNRIRHIKQHGYISEGIRHVAMYKCLSCKKYFIVIESYIARSMFDGNDVACEYFIHGIPKRVLERKDRDIVNT